MEKFDELKDLMDAKFNEINNKLLEMQNKINLLEIKFQIMFGSKGKNESEDKNKIVNNGWDQERIERIHREIDFIV
jgi:hypothetical protein